MTQKNAQHVHRGSPAEHRLGAIVGLIGAGVIFVSLFLEQLEPPAVFSGVAENSLAQSDDVFAFLLPGLVALSSLYAIVRDRSTKTVAINGLLALGYAFYLGMREDARTLYSLNEDGSAIPGTEVVADPGLGIYLYGLGGAIALVGGVMLIRARRDDSAEIAPVPPPPRSVPAVAGPNAPAPATKVCPDCAEAVLADARICRFCRHAFSTTPV